MLLASRDNASKLAEIDIIYVACIDRSTLGRINRLIYDRFIYSKNYSNRPSLLSPSNINDVYLCQFASIVTRSKKHSTVTSLLQQHKINFYFFVSHFFIYFYFFLQDCGSSKSVAQIRAGYHAETRADRRALRNA